MELIDVNRLYIPPEEMNARMAVAYAPRVDAIPVEWIKKWKEKAIDGSLCSGPLDLFDYYEYEAAINRLLEDWKKENETN